LIMTLRALGVARHRTLVVCLLWSVGVAGEPNAQGQSTLAGIVRDSAGRIVSGADVSVPALKRSVKTDSAGRFRIERLQPGHYSIRVRRVGFRPVDMPAGVAGDSIFLLIVMSRVDITLDTVVVKSACPSRGYQGFVCRQRAGGGGVFLDQIAIDSAKADQVGDLFFGQKGFRVAVDRHTGIKFPVATTGWKCVVTIVDGEALTKYTNRVPIRPAEIVAVEIYEKGEDVPKAYQGFSWRDGGNSGVKKQTIPSLPCGLVAYWTSKGR